VNEHEHVESTFSLFPRLVLAQLLAHDLGGIDLSKDFQADLLTHLVIEIQMA